MKLTSVTSWLTGQLKLPFKNDYPAHLDASPPYFHAHLRFLIRHNFLAGRQAKFTTRPEHVAPWAWSCILSKTTPEPPRPEEIIQNSDRRHRDRSKKYICSYLLTGPDRVPFRIGENCQKSRNSQLFTHFSKLLRHGPSSIATERSTTRKMLIFEWWLQLAFQLRVSGSIRPKSLRSGNLIMIE